MITNAAAKALKEGAEAVSAASTGVYLDAVRSCDRLGVSCLAIPLSGSDGAGKFALVDDEGLQALRQAGARALYLVKDGRGLSYVTFLQPPSRRSQTAARAICGDPEARRIEYVTGDRLDLRKQNLRVRDYAGIGCGRASPRAAS